MAQKIRLTLLSDSAAESRGKVHLNPGKGEPLTVFVKGKGDGVSAGDYVCGECGAILMAQVPEPMMANGALRCNSCGRYSDGLRPAKYAKPTTVHDIAKLKPPSEDYPPIEPPGHCPHDSVLEQLHKEFAARWRQVQGSRPRKLFHYTTLEGLRGILSTHQLWVTDVAYLNDSLEMQLGFSLVEEALNRKRESVSERCRSLLGRSRVSGSPTDAGSGYYVACFCEERDLLSQWRAYASFGGGYAVGFSAYEMATEGHVALRRVVYDEKTQQELIDTTIDRTCTEFEKLAKGKSEKELQDDHTLPSFAQLLASHLREYLAAFKHETFQEEREWRIILPWQREQHLKFVKFRNKLGFAVPYMALHPRTPTKEMPLLPIVEVIYGPTLHPDLTRKSLLLMLQSTDYDHVEVEGSRVPLRA